MAESDSLLSLFLAAALALALLLGLSDEAWAALRLFWAAFTTLSLMAYLEPLRRGLSKRGGGLPLSIFGAMALRGLVTGLLFSSVLVAFLSVR